MKEYLLPHFEERSSQIKMIVFHCSALKIEECIKVWNEYGVAPHYVIDETGEIFKVVEETKKAFHAGAGYWAGMDDGLNDISIGIELINLTMGQENYSELQIKSLISLCKKLMKQYNIDKTNIVGHSDIAPMRKSDPGVAFPWKKMALEGIGCWYGDKDSIYDEDNSDVKALLAKIGYDVRNDEAVIASAYAFRRHYLPEEVSIVADIQELLENPYPKGDISLLKGQKFINTLMKVVKSK